MSLPHNEQTDDFFRAVLSLSSLEECYRFFDDICTVRELQDLTNRLAVAKMLSEGKVYNDIIAETGASTATISRVNRCLLYGDGGYKTVLDNLLNKEKENEIETK